MYSIGKTLQRLKNITSSSEYDYREQNIPFLSLIDRKLDSYHYWTLNYSVKFNNNARVTKQIPTFKYKMMCHTKL